MNINTWQDVVAIALVIVALVYLGRRLLTLGKTKRSHHCVSCATCTGGSPKQTPPQQKPLISIDRQQPACPSETRGRT